jgi:beta-lactamase class A
MRFIVLALAALLFATSASAQGARPASSGLTKLLESELARFSGTAGIYVKHIPSGEEAMVRGNERFNSASTIKMAVMVLAYQMVDQKKLNLDERYELKASDYRGGSGILIYKDPGLKLTIRDVITQMTVTSDNTATDIMIAKVGGVARVNEFLKQQGFQTLRLNFTVGEVFRRRYELLDPKYKSLSMEDVYALGSNDPRFTGPKRELIDRIRAESQQKNLMALSRKTAMQEDMWLGTVSPAEMGRMMEGIEKATLVSKESSEEIKRIMRAQISGARKIPQFIDVPVAHKTGETGGVTNDVGIIFAKSGPIAIAVFNMGYTGNTGEADDRIGYVSRLVVEYFDGPQAAE